MTMCYLRVSISRVEQEVSLGTDHQLPPLTLPVKLPSLDRLQLTMSIAAKFNFTSDQIQNTPTMLEWTGEWALRPGVWTFSSLFTGTGNGRQRGHHAMLSE